MDVPLRTRHLWVWVQPCLMGSLSRNMEWLLLEPLCGKIRGSHVERFALLFLLIFLLFRIASVLWNCMTSTFLFVFTLTTAIHGVNFGNSSPFVTSLGLLVGTRKLWNWKVWTYFWPFQLNGLVKLKALYSQGLLHWGIFFIYLKILHQLQIDSLSSLFILFFSSVTDSMEWKFWGRYCEYWLGYIVKAFHLFLCFQPEVGQQSKYTHTVAGRRIKQTHEIKHIKQTHE